MTKVLSMASGRIWINNADPGASETNAEQGNFYLNSSSGNIFNCLNPTSGIQTWSRMLLPGVVVGDGGTGASTLTGILTGNGTSAFTASAVTQHGILLAGASNAVNSLGVASTGTVLIGNSAADPSFSATLPSAVQGNITSVGTIATGTWNGSAIIPTYGGTGASSFANANGVIYYDGSKLVSASSGTVGQILTSNGASSAPTTQSPGSTLNMITSINAKNTGNTAIFTVPAGISFYGQFIRVIATSANTVTVPCILSVGTSAGSYIDILPLTTMTSITSAGTFQNFPLSVALGAISAGTVISVNIGTAATATTLILTIQVIGSYL